MPSRKKQNQGTFLPALHFCGWCDEEFVTWPGGDNCYLAYQEKAITQLMERLRGVLHRPNRAYSEIWENETRELVREIDREREKRRAGKPK